MAGFGIGAVEVACAQACILGEGPVWDHRIARLHWVDIRGMAVLTLDPVTGITARVPTQEEVGFVVLSNDVDVVVAGLKSGLHKIDLRSGSSERLIEVEPNRPGNRINDGTVAADGAILFGTLDRDHVSASGTFWRYHRGELTALGGEMIVTNGPAMAGDGSTVLTVDSIGRALYRHSYRDGRLDGGVAFTQLPVGQGVPDGVAFDSDGHAWVAHYGGGRVTRLRPDGSVESAIHLPALQVTKCAFGGHDLKTMFITTAAYRRSLSDEPLAGCLFKHPVDVPGLPAQIADV